MPSHVRDGSIDNARAGVPSTTSRIVDFAYSAAKSTASRAGLSAWISVEGSGTTCSSAAAVTAASATVSARVSAWPASTARAASRPRPPVATANTSSGAYAQVNSAPNASTPQVRRRRREMANRIW
ncbi:MAG: hypothetical protein ACLGHP_04310 [Vicinamibacteria bacterium]